MIKEIKAPEIPDEYVPRLNKQSKNLYNLQCKDKYFLDLLFKSEEIEEILIHFLNDKYYKAIPQHLPNYVMRHCGVRSSEEAELPLHIDSFFPYSGEYVAAMQMMIFLEDSREDRGATLVIPGSHQSAKYAGELNEKPIPVEANAGDVILIDGRIHHGATSNRTNKTRYAMITTFSRWCFKQMFDIPSAIPYNIRKTLTAKELSILGFNSQPFKDETFGIDMKQGYSE